MSKTPDKPAGYTVGITLPAAASPAGQPSRALQAAVFLHQMFKASPTCGRALLIGDINTLAGIDLAAIGLQASDISALDPVDHRLDYLIVVERTVVRERLDNLRARGCRVILYKHESGATQSMQAIASRPLAQPGETYEDRACYDQVWMIEPIAKLYAGWCRTLYRCPVIVVPPLWSPTFAPAPLARAIPAREPWKIAILDPNDTVTRTSHYGLLVCEAAHRARKDILAHVYVSHSQKFAEVFHFRRFCNALDLQHDKLLSVEADTVDRIIIDDLSDAVVTHQWEAGFPYQYCELLHRGFPLIHNSPALGGAGYPYDEFDAASGGAVLTTAFDHHHERAEDYAKATRALFARLAPTLKGNIRQHEQRLIGGPW